MDIKVRYQNNDDGAIWDISEMVSKVTWRTDIYGQPGKLLIDVVKSDKLIYNEGSIITFSVDDLNTFYGYIFTVTATEADIIKIECYDQLRYLKNKDTYVFKSSTLGEQFNAVCSDYELQHAVIHSPVYSLPAVIYDNKSLYELLQDGADKTLIAENKWFFMRDNYGTLELLEISELKTNFVFSTDRNIMSFSSKVSIDKDTYNYIKLVKENKTDGIREIYIVKDSSTIKKWGRLQYFNKVEEDANAAQIEQLADDLIKTKNRPTKTMKFKGLGVLPLSAGDGIVLQVEDYQVSGLEVGIYYFIKTCIHTFANDEHYMDIDVEVSI